MTVLHPGGCLCGKVRFEASGPPVRTVHCHCAFCRRQTGAPVSTFAGFVRSTNFRATRGSAAAYRSSPAVRRSFCRNCGSPLFYERDGDLIYVLVGAFDDPDAFPPSCHVHAEQKLAWFDMADGLPRHRGAEPRPAP